MPAKRGRQAGEALFLAYPEVCGEGRLDTLHDVGR